MKPGKRMIATLARNHRLDSDELILSIWENSDQRRFEYLKDERSIVRNKDYKFVRDVIRLLKNQDPQHKPPKVTKVEKRKDYDFSTVGHIAEKIQYLVKEDVLKIHEILSSDLQNQKEDPINPPGLKDHKLLESALFHARTGYAGRVKYPSVISTSAALMYSLSQNHAFHNGNKRVALVSTLVFLDKHNICLICSEADLFRIVMDLAKHELITEEAGYSDAEIFELAKWIRKNSKIMKKGERSISLNKLKQILSHFNCEILENRKIRRTVIYQNRFGFERRKILTAAKHLPSTMGDGKAVDPRLIKSIREDLELDVDHNIDSVTFYSQTEFSTSEFIIKYKSTLRRLSKF